MENELDYFSKHSGQVSFLLLALGYRVLPLLLLSHRLFGTCRTGSPGEDTGYLLCARDLDTYLSALLSFSFFRWREKRLQPHGDFDA